MEAIDLFAVTEETVTDGSKRKVHHDAGEKIGGAKKDRFIKTITLDDLNNMEASEAYIAVNKHDLLGKIDIEIEQANGVTSGAAFLKKKIIDALYVRPRDSQKAREEFLLLCQKIKEGFDTSCSVKDVETSVRNWREGRSFSFSTVQEKKFFNTVSKIGYGRINMSAERYEKENDWSWAATKKAAQPSEKFKFTRVVEKEVKRVGGIEVDPQLVDEKMVVDVLGFRAVEFGNWISDKDAKYHIQNAIQSLFDLSEVLCIPGSMVSWNGKLAIAFGARGSGDASAHYEPARAVINLTKFRGGGSLAHELGHAYDNFLAEKSGGKAYYASEERHGHNYGYNEPLLYGVMKAIREGNLKGDPRNRYYELREINSKLWAECHARFKTEGFTDRNREFRERLWKEDQNLEKMRKSYNKKGVLGSSNFYRSAKLMGEYWVRPQELFARAFEAYIEDKLTAMVRRNTYLVCGTQSPYSLSRDEEFNIEPYPQGEERRVLYYEFEKLFDRIRQTNRLYRLPVAA